MNVTAAPQARTLVWSELAAVAGFCAFLFFYGLGNFGLVGADEPRYAQIAREMLARRDWVMPLLNGVPWLEKPALYYWSAILSFKIFGVSDWAARVPSAVFATAMIAAIYGFMRRFREGMQLDAALMAASPAAIIGFARGASTDMPLAATFTMGMLAWYTWRETRRKLWLAGFYLMMALGTLAKGPVAPVLAGLIVVIFAFLSSDGAAEAMPLPRLDSGARAKGRRLIAQTLWIPGILLFFAVALPWYVAVQMKTHEFFRVFILQHNLERFGTNLYRHKQPFWYYLPVFVLSVLPWTEYVIAAMIAAVRGETHNAPTSDKTGQMWDTTELRTFLLIWIAVPLAVFTISQSKLPGYILPAIPPCALLLAEWLRSNFGNEPHTRGRVSHTVADTALQVGHSMVCGALLGAALLAPYFIVRMRPPAQATTIAALAAAVIATAMMISLRWQGLRILRFVTLVPVVLGLGFVLRVSAPLIDQAQSARPVAQELSRLDTQHARLAAFNVPRELEYGLDFYRNQPVMRYERGEVPAADHLLLARSGSEPQLSPFLTGRRLSHVGGFRPQHLEFYWVSSGGGHR